MVSCPLCHQSDNQQLVLIYVDDYCYAIPSPAPVNPGHVIVVPKRHYESSTDLPDSLLAHMAVVQKKLNRAIQAATQAVMITHIFDDDKINGGFNQIAHFKVHIIPRFIDDGVRLNWNRNENPDTQDQIDMATKISSFLPIPTSIEDNCNVGCSHMETQEACPIHGLGVA